MQEAVEGALLVEAQDWARMMLTSMAFSRPSITCSTSRSHWARPVA